MKSTSVWILNYYFLKSIEFGWLILQIWLETEQASLYKQMLQQQSNCPFHAKKNLLGFQKGLTSKDPRYSHLQRKRGRERKPIFIFKTFEICTAAYQKSRCSLSP